ncbi:ATP-binding protein [Jannaschia sp. R86511]|uniref:ATP-binding protein n=1 Tax=Jannaschia sp. R86511 TaxID=3093853 RepID=UPI0036D4384D
MSTRVRLRRRADQHPDTTATTDAADLTHVADGQHRARTSRWTAWRSTTSSPADFPPLPLALRGIQGNVTITRKGLRAWYRLGPQQWSWQGDERRENLIRQIGDTYSALAGRTIHLRSVQRPYPIHTWAKALADDTPDPVSRQAWGEHLVAVQRHLRGSTFSDTETYLGVSLQVTHHGDRISKRTTAKLTTDLTRLDALLGTPGLDGVRATQGEVEWLVHRSLGLGLPQPHTTVDGMTVPLEASDLTMFTGTLDIDPSPGRPHVRLVARPQRTGDATTLERYLAVLSVGRMEGLTIPQSHLPWMAYANSLPFPVEWSGSIRVLSGREAAASMQTRIDQVVDQEQQYTASASVEVPPSLRRTGEQARATADEIADGGVHAVARIDGRFQLAVTAASPAELEDRVNAALNHYRDYRVELHRDPDQYGLHREFIPGEPAASSAHRRRGKTEFLAAGLPHLSSAVGTRDGSYVGYTVGTSRRAVAWNLHHAMEVRERSGFTPVIGGLGSGKSVVVGSLAYDATLRGICTTVFDPSGPLARLTLIPQIAAVSQYVDLLRSEAGTLSPYAAVPEPERHNLVDDERLMGLHGPAHEEKLDEVFADALYLAGRRRMQLATDTLRLLLPPEIRRARESSHVIRNAVRHVGGGHDASLGQVLDAIRADARDADHEIYDVLRDMAEFPSARLFFTAGDTSQPPVRSAEPTLLVFTLGGLTLPEPDAEETNWTEDERISVPLLSLAANYASRRVYGRRMGERKVVVIDEAHALRRTPAGRALVERFARDSRKWNTRVLAASQKPGDLLSLEAGGLIDECIIGGIEDPDEAAAALRLARIPTGLGYERAVATLALGGLRPHVGQGRTGARDVILRDADGYTERVRWDLGHLPHVLQALDTTAVGNPTRPDQSHPIDLRSTKHAATHRGHRTPDVTRLNGSETGTDAHAEDWSVA